MRFTMVGHSTVLIETGSLRILTDPYFGTWGNPAYRRLRPAGRSREELTGVNVDHGRRGDPRGPWTPYGDHRRIRDPGSGSHGPFRGGRLLGLQPRPPLLRTRQTPEGFAQRLA